MYSRPSYTFSHVERTEENTNTRVDGGGYHARDTPFFKDKLLFLRKSRPLFPTPSTTNHQTPDSITGYSIQISHQPLPREVQQPNQIQTISPSFFQVCSRHATTHRNLSDSVHNTPITQRNLNKPQLPDQPNGELIGTFPKLICTSFSIPTSHPPSWSFLVLLGVQGSIVSPITNKLRNDAHVSSAASCKCADFAQWPVLHAVERIGIPVGRPRSGGALLGSSQASRISKWMICPASKS